MDFYSYSQLGAAKNFATALRKRRDVKMFYNTALEILVVLAAVWVIYDVLVNNKKLSDGMKVMWIIFAILFSLITAIIYYFIGRNAKSDLFARKNNFS